MRRRSRGIFCISAAALLVCAVPGDVGAQETAGALDRSSPRAAMRSFYEAMTRVEAGEDEQTDAALACLYLDTIPEDQRRFAGVELARRLYEVLDSITWSLDALPEDHAERNYVARLGDNGRVTLHLRRYDDGFWRFNYSETLSSLDELHRTVVANPEGPAEESGYDDVLSSPRAAMRVYLTGFTRWREGGMSAVLSALDLRALEEGIREEKGREAAVLLKRTLDRHKRIELNEIPNASDAPPYTVLNAAAGRIALAPVVDAETGIKSWKIAAESVENAQALWDEFRDRPLADGVVDNTPPIYSLVVRDWVSDQAPFLLQRSLVLENWQWLGLFLIIFVGMLVSRFIGWLLILMIRRMVRDDAEAINAKLEKNFVKPVRIALMAWVWLLGFSVLGLPGQALYYLVVGARSVSAVAGLWAIYRLVDILSGVLTVRAARTPNKFDDILVALFSRSLKVFVLAVGFVVVLDIIGLPYRNVLAGLGLGGLAFALAAKDTVSNFFGSLTVVLDRPFTIGDWVNINGIEGTVETVGIRSTRIRTFYNSLITVPNAKLIDTSIDNYGARRYRRIRTHLSLTYDTPPERIEAFCEGIRELIRRHPYTWKQNYHVYLNEFSAASLDVLLYCFVETPDWGTELRERERLYLDILRLAKELGVEFAFPTQTLYIRQDEAPVHDNGLHTRREAFESGRHSADRVVSPTLRGGQRKPPPVHYRGPEGIEADLYEAEPTDQDPRN